MDPVAETVTTTPANSSASAVAVSTRNSEPLVQLTEPSEVWKSRTNLILT